MTAEDFEYLLLRRQALTRETLIQKAREYATDADRLHNFRVAASLQDDTLAQACLGMLRKHWVSLMDLAQDQIENGTIADAHRIDEKLGDAINYLHLLEACLRGDSKL